MPLGQAFPPIPAVNATLGGGADVELETLLNPNRLPVGMRRAGSEIYTGIIASGYSSLCLYLNDLFPIATREGNGTYLAFFNNLKAIDMQLADLDARGKLAFLASSDFSEISLRHLAAHLHEKRTGDKDAADDMLALRPSGSRCDIAPNWMLSSAALHSQAEHKRRERAKAQKGGGGQPKGGQPKGGAPKGGGPKGGPKKGQPRDSGGAKKSD